MKEQSQNEFYVGYLPMAPAGISKTIRYSIIVLGTLVLAISSLLVYHQRPFSPNNFDYGTVTTLEGQLYNTPVPHLNVFLGKDIYGHSHSQTILLVGFGKAGANQFIRKEERRFGITFSGQTVRLNGSIIYGDGKAILQVEERAEIEIVRDKTGAVNEFDAAIHKEITGQIVDPKCFFGVMKPGEGKVHRSCAIRCIAGGIPPILKSDNEYFIVTDETLNPVGDLILPIVDDRITLQGNVILFNDWKILMVKRTQLKQLAKNKIDAEYLRVLEEGITACTN